MKILLDNDVTRCRNFQLQTIMIVLEAIMILLPRFHHIYFRGHNYNISVQVSNYNNRKYPDRG